MKVEVMNSNLNEKLYYEDCELLKRVAVFIMAITIYYVSWYYGKDILMNLFYGYIKNGVLKPKLFFSHLLIYGSIFSAICSYIMIFIAYKLGVIRLPKYLVNIKAALLYGIVSALVLSVLFIIYWLIRGYDFQFLINSQSILGNIFSNYYEEISYRALLVGVSLALFRNKWIAIVIPSLIMVSTHTQYPFEFKCLVFLGSCFFSYVYIRTSNLVSSWSSHQVSDIVLDTILKV
ncbi:MULTISPECIES: type II CAAX prenyl endopeptidase Rce1 family protein [unclassified Halobacteriovorax]|uniref:CPBP family glutamic-type intramembrane protease n=1 Tax=unclassified Halobacteriovorax TaxID=2639665 RepID=UPI00399A6477